MSYWCYSVIYCVHLQGTLNVEALYLSKMSPNLLQTVFVTSQKTVLPYSSQWKPQMSLRTAWLLDFMEFIHCRVEHYTMAVCTFSVISNFLRIDLKEQHCIFCFRCGKTASKVNETLKTSVSGTATERTQTSEWFS